MATTVTGTLLTHGLAVGVGPGVPTACALSARPVAQVGDASTVAALDATTHEHALRGECVGLDGHSADRSGRHTGQLAGAH